MSLVNLLPSHLSVYLFFGIIQGVIFTRWQTEIFDWNPELGFATIAKKTNKGKEYLFLKDKRIEYKNNSPRSNRYVRRIKMFLGILIGWILLWILLEKRLNYLSNSSLKLEDFALFILALVAISGRLFVIADSVQEWFKR